MKFIRLVGSNNANDGILDNEFNQDIKIEEGSQIAYRSLAVDLDPQEFTVDASNNEISFQSNINDAATIGTANLTAPVTYNTENAEDLLSDLQKAINNSLLYNTKNVGTQFQVIIKNGKTRVESKFSPNSKQLFLDNVSGNFGSTLNNANISGTSITNNSATSLLTDNNLIFSHQPLGKGCSLFRTRIRSIGLGGDNSAYGFEFGVSDTKPTTWNTTGNFTLSNLQKTYNVKIAIPTSNYLINDKTATDSDTGISPGVQTAGNRLTNDIIEIVKVGKNLELRLYRNGLGALDLLSTTNLETTYNGAGEFGVEQPLYPYIVLHGNQNNTALDVSYTRCYFDPFVANVTPTTATTIEEQADGNNHQSLSVRPIRVLPVTRVNGQLGFASSQTANHLGFERTALLGELDGSNFLVHSKNAYTAALTYDNLVVELMNLQVDSYDGLEKGRRNIIATIPTNSDLNGVIVNEANNLVFIDLDNAQPRFFRNIKARLLYGDLTDVKTIGLTSLSLLIKKKSE